MGNVNGGAVSNVKGGAWGGCEGCWEGIVRGSAVGCERPGGKAALQITTPYFAGGLALVHR